MSGLPCNERMDCTQCPKAVENSIHYTHNKKGFHLPPHKCETNILFFLLKGQILINSEEYAGTIINSGEFVLQAIASKVEILTRKVFCTHLMTLKPSAMTAIPIY